MIRSAYLEFANGMPRAVDAITGRQIPPVSRRLLEQAIKTDPPWINSDLYSIDAKSESAQSKEMMRGPMMQALLEDRFRLKIHRETREIPVYTLTVDKGGPKLKVAKQGSCLPEKEVAKGPPEPGQPLTPICGVFLYSINGASDAFRQTMAGLCRDLSSILDRDVIDKTGIAGAFDIHMDFSPADLPNRPGNLNVPSSAPDRASDPTGSSVFSAVTSLGLKLKPAKGAGESLVIDHVERPSEN